MSASINLDGPQKQRIIVEVRTPEHESSAGIVLEIVPGGTDPEVTIRTRERDIGEDWQLLREQRKNVVLRTYLALQALNFLLLWLGVLPTLLAITANIYFTWRIKDLLS